MKKHLTKHLLCAWLLWCVLPTWGYAQAPTIASFSPTSGVVGATVTISGTNFDATHTNNTVYFGGIKATSSAGNITSITVAVPAGATSVAPITVVNRITGLQASSLRVTGTNNPYFTVTYAATQNITASSFTVQNIALSTSGTGEAVTAGDFNNDGKPDIAVGINDNTATDNIAILINNGAGGFNAPVSYGNTNTLYIYAVRAGDIDNDGDLDLVANTYNVGSNQIHVLQNDGTGVFTTPTTYNNTDTAYEVFLADFNNDGRLDIITNGRGRAHLLLNTGGMAFGASTQIGGANASEDISIGDFNKDGNVDFMSSAYGSSQVFRFLGNGAGGFDAGTGYATGLQTGHSTVGLFIGSDTSPDVVAGTYTGSSIALMQNTAGALGTASPISGTDPRGHITVDLNGDGLHDVLSMRYDPSRNPLIFLNNGTTLNTPIILTSASASGTGTATFDATDFNGDGFVDFVASTDGANIKVNRFVPTDFYTIGNATWNINGNWSYADGGVDCNCNPAGVANANVRIKTAHAVVVPNAGDIGTGNTIDIQGSGLLTLSNGNTNPIATFTTSGTSSVILNGTGNFNLASPATTTINGQLTRATTGTFPNNLTFAAGSSYNHERNGGAIPTATWSPTSTCIITGVTSTVPTGFGQTFGNLTWNCTGQIGTITLSGTITIAGNLTLTSSGGQSLSFGTSIVNIRGNMVHNIGASFDPGTSSFVFNSTTNSQSISGSPTFRDLTIDNTHTTPAVTVPTSITVQNALTLTNGRLVASSGTDITFNGAVANLTRTNGWIATNGTGKLARGTGGTNVLFPIGSTTVYQPIRIVTCAGSASARFGTPTLAVPNSGVGSWFINNGATNSNVVIVNPQGGTLTASSKVHKYNTPTASNWNILPTTFASSEYTAIGALAGSAVEVSVYTNATGFITTWQTTDGSITIPTTGGGYNYTATCTNITTGTIGNASVSGQTGNVTFSGLTNGNTYQVVITGTFPRIYFNDGLEGQHKTKIKTIEQWGNIAWTSMQNAFWGCNTLQLNATDAPNLSSVTDMSNMFKACTAFTGNSSMNSWNTSNVTNMSEMFRAANAFNQNISAWNTSAVINMNQMFFAAFVFNQPLNTWNVGNVQDMTAMFRWAYAFDQPLNAWNVSNVTNMTLMFNSNTTSAFNQNLSSWNVGKVNNFESMFQGATAFNSPLAWTTLGATATSISMINMFRSASVFNQDISGWNTSKVANMSGMFREALAFNQNISSWNTGLVTNMDGMFLQAQVFNQPIGSWNVGNVTNMNQMFQWAYVFNQPLNSWNTSKVTNMTSLFQEITLFNQPLNNWNTGAVTQMGLMFYGTNGFNQDLSTWNVSNVVNMNGMFRWATAFNRNLSTWNVSNVANMNEMFYFATAFNQSLASWQLRSAGVIMTNMLDACGMNTANYDATLIGWAGQASPPTGVTFGASGRTYCTAFGARETLDIAKTWTFVGDALSGSCPSFSAVTATNVTATSFTANWTALFPPYTLEVANNPTFTPVLATYSGLTVTNYNVTGLSVGTYYYRVTNAVPTISNTKAVSTNLPAGSGNALTFNGTTQKVDATNSSAFNFTNANNFTLEAWIKINPAGTGNRNIISKRGGATGYSLQVTAGGHLGVFRDNTFSSGTTILPTNTWLHVAVAYNSGGGFTSYINGVVEDTQSGSVITSNALNLTIGSRPDNTLLFDGEIDEVKIWNVARTEAQIRTSMCSKLVGTESGLVGYFRLDENTGTTVENKAYLATTDGTLVNSPTWATSSAPLGDVSAYTYTVASGVTLTNTDVMQASNITGSPTAVHLYKINTAITGTTKPTNYASLYTDRAWGMFFVGGTAPQATLAYNYSANTTVDVANALRFAQRDNNADLTWASMGGVQNRLVKKLTHAETSAGEYILAERNALITNYKDGGTVLTYDNTNTGYVQMPRYVENDFTIEFWLRTTQNGGGSTDWFTGVGLVDASSGTNDFGISLLGTKVAFGTRSGSATTILSTSNVNDGKWTHVAVTRAGANLVLYIDGKPEATSTIATTATLNGTANIHIGKLQGGANFFNGSIDELRIWNVALSEINIKNWVNLRAQDQHPNFANLEAYYRFDENTGILTEDLVNGNDASLNGGVVWADANQPLGDGAVSRLIVPATSGTVSVFPEAGVTMNFGAITPNGEVVATRIDGEPESYPAVAGMSFMNAYWVIRNYGTNQTFSALPEITFEVPAGNTISATDLATPFNIKLYKRPDDAIGGTVGVGNWRAVASATGFGSVRFGGDCCSGGGGGTSIEDYSQFVIGSASSPLPITLLGLKGERVEGLRGEKTEEVRLEWSTASEINNKGFEVEMSANGLAYTKIAFVDGKGNSTTVMSYELRVHNADDAYYRLKQVDFNGTFSYSPVVFVTGMVGKDFVIVYPNPAQADLKLKVSESILPTEILKVEVYNIAGKRVWRGVGKLAEVQASLQTSFRSWKTGTYLLQLRTDKKRLQTKFIKE